MMGADACGGTEKTIFTLHILTKLKNAFPVPIFLEKHLAFERIGGFTELRLLAEDAAKQPAEPARSGQSPVKAAPDNSPAATVEIGNMAPGDAAGAGVNDESCPLSLPGEQYRRKKRELSEIWERTIEYLQAQGDIRVIDNKYLLAEPGSAERKSMKMPQ